jgi:hypothetical protein
MHPSKTGCKKHDPSPGAAIGLNDFVLLFWALILTRQHRFLRITLRCLVLFMIELLHFCITKIFKEI